MDSTSKKNDRGQVFGYYVSGKAPKFDFLRIYNQKQRIYPFYNAMYDKLYIYLQYLP